MTKKIPEPLSSPPEAAAVICELNPPHFGHRALFDEVKRHYAGLVCILSGNFVQRGDTAILDKWARAALALELGADLVVELPLPWACAGAERFAAGGVALANALNAVTALYFGSEVTDISLFGKTALALLSPEFSERLSALPDTGEPFAKRRERVLTELLGEEARPLLRAPNAILGVEYCKAILAQDSELVPRAFPRIGAGHDSPAGPGEILSGSELREHLYQKKSITGLVPECTEAMLSKEMSAGRCPSDIRLLERPMLCKLRTMSLEEFADLPDVSEGLENRLYRAARQAGSLEGFYTLAKSRRVSHARIRRLALYAFLGLTKEQPALPPYLRVLGMTAVGEKLLRGNASTLPLALRPVDFEKLGGESLSLFQLEAQADDLYALSLPTPAPCGREYTEKLLKL